MFHSIPFHSKRGGRELTSTTLFSDTSRNCEVCCSMDRTALLMFTTQAGSSWWAQMDSTRPSCQDSKRGRCSSSLLSTCQRQCNHQLNSNHLTYMIIFYCCLAEEEEELVVKRTLSSRPLMEVCLNWRTTSHAARKVSTA